MRRASWCRTREHEEDRRLRHDRRAAKLHEMTGRLLVLPLTLLWLAACDDRKTVKEDRWLAAPASLCAADAAACDDAAVAGQASCGDGAPSVCGEVR